jgi:nitrite reductase/ring-hydroxylating ferredoxin subunit
VASLRPAAPEARSLLAVQPFPSHGVKLRTSLSPPGAPEEPDMTDILTSAQLQPSASQLPISWYFDPDIFAQEQKLIFERGPGYVGHELMVPDAGDYYTLDWANHGKMLMRSEKAVHLFNNICRHRQSMLLEGRGNVGNIVCPVHKWTYGLDGKLMGAPEFDCNPNMGLVETPLSSWHGLLFRGPRDAAKDLADFPLATSSTSAATYSSARKSTCSSTTGRTSSRSSWRCTTSCRSTPVCSTSWIRATTSGASASAGPTRSWASRTS